MFSNLTRRLLAPVAIGLDISDLTIKFARVVSSSRGPILEHWGEIMLAPGLIEEGVIRHEQEFTLALSKKLRGDPNFVRERYCVASLPEEKSFLRVLSLPPMPERDVAKAVRWEIEGAVPLPLDDIFYDSEIIPTPEPRKHAEILLTAFPKDLILGYSRALERAGFNPLALELESQAISRALIPPHERGDTVMIADLGMNRTSFIIFSHGGPLFTKSVAIGGKDFEQAIAERLGVAPDEARRIKITSGLSRQAEEPKTAEALQPHLETIAKEIEEQLWFAEHHASLGESPLAPVSRVLLCGGDANLTGIERFLASRIHVPVSLGDPFSNFTFAADEVPPIPKTDALKYTTTIGLALRAAGYT